MIIEIPVEIAVMIAVMCLVVIVWGGVIFDTYRAVNRAGKRLDKTRHRFIWNRGLTVILSYEQALILMLAVQVGGYGGLWTVVQYIMGAQSVYSIWIAYETRRYYKENVSIWLLEVKADGKSEDGA